MINVTCTCEGSPVQYEGDVDGYPCYFRARWGHWAFTIVAPGDSPVSAQFDARNTALYYHSEPYGDDGFSAGAMPLEEAETFIMRCVDEWRKSRSGHEND